MMSTIIEGPYLLDILDQPQALDNAIDNMNSNAGLEQITADLAAGRYQNMVLTGMGSSLHALYPLNLALHRGGHNPVCVETAELLLGYESFFSQATLLVAVSQSGESAEMVRLLRRKEEFGHILGVTNQPGSSLGKKAGTTLLIHSGQESAVSCKSYVNTLAVLHWLGVVLCRGDQALVRAELRTAASGVRDYLLRWREHVEELLPLTEGIQSVFAVGRSESLATTATAGLILKESTRKHAEGMSCAAFRHGPMEMAGKQALVIVFEGNERTSALNRRLVDDLQHGGGKAVLAAVHGASAMAFRLPRTCPALQPIVEILPIQMLSLALAARDGREAGRFERASKITTIE